MSDRHQAGPRLLRYIEKWFGIVVLTLAGLFVLAFLGFAEPVFALLDILWHLATGFVGFLSGNLHRISSDAGTWGPGLAAFLLALVVIHGFGRAWARRQQRSWQVSTTLALGMLLPLLFAISFLVPGALLQAGRLSSSSWYARERSEKVYSRAALQKVLFALLDYEEEHRHLPDTLQVLIEAGTLRKTDLVHKEQGLGQPPEPFIYLGKGLNLSSDPALPLVISPRYSEQGIFKRQLMTTGLQIIDIRDDELDAWVDQAVAARDGMKP